MKVENLKEYVEKKPNHTFTEIAQTLSLRRTTVFVWLNRLNINPKKNAFYYVGLLDF